MTGFAQGAVLSVAGTVVDAVKSGAIKHFFLVGGCDGARPGRNYYTDFVKATPDDTVVLTLYTQHSEQPNLKSQSISWTKETPAWQYEDEPIGLDVYFVHQKEIQEKGERLASYIQQQITINIE